MTLQSKRTAGQDTSKPRSFPTRVLKPVGNFVAEKGLLAAYTVGCFSLGVYGIVADIQQTHSIEHSLNTEALRTIPGSLGASVVGTMINRTEGRVHDAQVTLATGSQCDIQFTTTAGPRLLDELFPNQARIVSTGTCPTGSSSNR